MGESNVASARETLRRQLFATEDVLIDGESVPENKKEALRWENASSAQWRCVGGARVVAAACVFCSRALPELHAHMLFWRARRGFGGS